MNTYLVNLPRDIINIIISYHPYFFNYKREYISLSVYNSIPIKSSIISLTKYNILKEKFMNINSDIMLDKTKIVYTLALFYEVNCSEDDNNRLDYIF